MKSSSQFSRRGPDRVADELAAVLSSADSFEFKPLFTVVHANLKARNAASGGEEMLRLRVYEKLQNFVRVGIVNRTGKEYRGVASPLAKFIESAAALNAQFDARALSRQSATKAEVPAPATGTKSRKTARPARTTASAN